MTLGACASGIAGYGGTAGHCPPLAPSARNGASPHHARGPLVSASAAAARCLPLPAAASRVTSATSPRASPEYAAAACRVAKATSRGGGDQRREGAREITPVAHTCPPAAPLNTSLHPLYPLPFHPFLGHTPSTVPTVSLLRPPPPPLPAAGIPPRNAPPPPGPPAGKTRRGSSLG